MGGHGGKHPRAKVFLAPAFIGVHDDVARGTHVGVTRLGTVFPDSRISVNLVGLVFELNSERYEDQSVGACNRSHEEMLDHEMSYM